MCGGRRRISITTRAIGQRRFRWFGGASNRASRHFFPPLALSAWSYPRLPATRRRSGAWPDDQVWKKNKKKMEERNGAGGGRGCMVGIGSTSVVKVARVGFFFRESVRLPP